MTASFHRVAPRQCYSLMKLAVESNLVPFVRSSPGIGKSSLAKKLAKEMNLKLIDHRLSTSEPTDMSGLPDFKDGYAIFAPFRDLFPLADQELPEGKAGWLLFLDEFNSADRAVMKAAYKLILDRMVGQHRLHSKVHIVCAGNLDTDRAITEEVGTAMQSRLVHLEMEHSFDEWYQDVAAVEGYHPTLTAFLQQFPSRLMDFKPDHQDKTFCCPRTWEFVNRIMRTVGKLDDIHTPLIAGTITSGVAAELIQFSKMAEKMVKFSDVVASPNSCKIPEDNALIWATIMHLIEHINEEIDPDHFEAVLKYVDRNQLTYRIVFYRTITLKFPEVLELPNFRTRISELAQYLK